MKKILSLTTIAAAVFGLGLAVSTPVLAADTAASHLKEASRILDGLDEEGKGIDKTKLDAAKKHIATAIETNEAVAKALTGEKKER